MVVVIHQFFDIDMVAGRIEKDHSDRFVLNVQGGQHLSAGHLQIAQDSNEIVIIVQHIASAFPLLLIEKLVEGLHRRDFGRDNQNTLFPSCFKRTDIRLFRIVESFRIP